MVAYGPWTQDPDYDRVLMLNDSFRSDEFPNAEYGVGDVEYVSTEYAPLSEGDLMASLSAATSNVRKEGGHPFRTGVHLRWGWSNGTIGEENWVSEARVSHDYRPWPVRPTSDFYSPSTWPADAVDIEWQDPVNDGRSEWLTATMRDATRLGGVNWDLTDPDTPGGQPLRDGDFVTQVRFGYYNGAGWSTSSGDPTIATVYYDNQGGIDPVYRTLGAEVDLTNLLNADGFGWIYTLTSSFVAPHHSPGIIHPNNAQGPYSYGWVIDRLGIRWRYRPPVYRWVYDEEAPVTYRRTFPRDDSLAGGAGRNFPRPRSVQSSNRIGGGYL